MTTVDFRLDEASLAEDLQHAPESADRGALEETYFVMPVRLCVNGVELLEHPGRAKRNVFIGAGEQGVQRIQLPNEASSWLPLPLLGFAKDVLQALNETKPGKERKLYLAGGGELVFVRQGEQLSVASSITGKSASTQFAEVLNAFRTFSEKVRQLLVGRVPGIQQHPSWRQWFS
jgi:hypothetical protein